MNIEGLIPSSFKEKLPLIKETLAESNTIIASFTESHLNHNIKDAEVHISGYNIISTDRTNRKKGGIITYMKEDLPSLQVLLSTSNSFTEAQVIYLKDLDIIFTTVYRPPACPTQAFLEPMNAIRSIIDSYTPQPNIILTGDFNLPIINWSLDAINGGSYSDRTQALHLQSFAQDFCLTQVITEPTRQNNILDLIFINNEELLHSYEILPTNLSDHNIISITTKISSLPLSPKNSPVSPTLPINFSGLNFFSKEVSWDGLRDSLASVDWTALLEHKTPTEQLDAFLETLLIASTQNVPLRASRLSKKSIIPRDRRLLMRRRGKLRRKLRTITNENQKTGVNQQIRRIEAALVESTSSELTNNEARAVQSIKANPKYFYSYAAKKSKVLTPVGPLEVGGQTITDPQEISNIIRDQYETVFSTPLQDKTINCPSDFFMATDNLNHENELHNINITTTDITEAITTLSNNSAAGPDYVPAVLLKKCSDQLAIPLCTFYTNSLTTGVIPQLLRSAKITPVFKGGSRDEAKNYRPIALTSHIIKIFEKIITRNITEFLELNNKMNDGQHGFRKGRSCLSQLLAHHDRLITSLETNTDVDVIYLDFAKAFDKVDHGVLLHKLRALGISGRLGLWVSAFLSDRTQFVAVSGAESSVSTVVSGVPQGSVLGPLLFIIHIHDINNNIINSTVTSFADDTRISMAVNNADDSTLLQTDLNSIYEWAETNNMKFNDSKFEHLHYSSLPINAINTSYQAPDGNTITMQPNVRDLGVCLSNDATFTEHITSTAKKARGQLGWILRTFRTRDPLPMMTLYKSLVVPLLEYCCQLWSPHRPGDIQTIEAVQRTFTYRITSLRNLNYWERLQSLKLYSLERRRERYLILYVWKTKQGMCPNHTELRFHTHQRKGWFCTEDRVHPRALTRIKTLKSNSFSMRGPALFNALPKTLRDLEEITLEQFKARLDKFLKLIPDEPHLPQYHSRAPTNSIIDWLALRRADGDFTYPGAATHRDPEAELRN